MKVRVWIWKYLILKSLILHWYYSERIQPPVFRVWYASHQILACSFTRIELISRQGRVTTSILFSQFNYQKYQWRSSRCWTRTVARQSSIWGALRLCWGALRSCRGAWHSNLTKIPRIYSVSYFTLGGLRALFGSAKPSKTPPVATGLCWTAPVTSIVSSKLTDVFLNENTRMNLDQFLK